MTTERRLCVICAWREHCQKRFSVTYNGSLNIHCPDFTRDYTIRDLEADKQVVEAVLDKWRKEGLTGPRPCITIPGNRRPVEARSPGGWLPTSRWTSWAARSFPAWPKARA